MTAFANGDYTTNIRLEDVTDGPAWIAYEEDVRPWTPSTAGLDASLWQVGEEGR